MRRARANSNYSQSSSHEAEESDRSEDDAPSSARERPLGHQSGSTTVPADQDQGGYGVLLLVASLIAALAVFLYFYKPNPDYEKITIELESMITNLKIQFPTQEKQLWSYLYAVLSKISTSSCPTVLLLLYQGSGATERTSDCIVKKVTTLSAPILPFEEKKAWYLNSKDLNSDSIEVQRENVQKHGIVVIQNLETFPVESAQFLHFFCDEHETEFGKAVYLITMSVNDIKKNPTKTAENMLRSVWSSMPESHLEPLISRLTSLVAFIQPETALNCD